MAALALAAAGLGGCLSLPESAELDINAERKVCIGVTVTISKRLVIEPAPEP